MLHWCIISIRLCWVRVGGGVTARWDGCQARRHASRQRFTTCKGETNRYCSCETTGCRQTTEVVKYHCLQWRETSVFETERNHCFRGSEIPLLEMARPADSLNQKPLMKIARDHCLRWWETTEMARPADSRNEKPLMKMPRDHCLRRWNTTVFEMVRDRCSRLWNQQIVLIRNH